MGFRFRKSIGAGPFRINFSKSGVGYSFGTKGYRVTKKAGGGIRTTASIPGTGISYVKETSSKKKIASTQKTSSDYPKNTQGGNGMDKPKNIKTELLLCLLLGWAGGHKFYRKKIGMGILYLLTFGLFFIGWWGDLIGILLAKLSKKDTAELPKASKVASYILALFFVAALGSCGTEAENVTPPTESTSPTIIVTETTDAPTESPTDPIETAAHTEAPTDPIETAAHTEAPTTPVAAASTDAPTESNETAAPTEAPTEAETEPVGTTYVLNTNTRKFHYTSCSSVSNIKASNKGSHIGTRDEVIAMGYEPCGRCHP